MPSLVRQKGMEGVGLERHLNHLGLVVGFVGAFDPLLFDALCFLMVKKRVVVDAKRVFFFICAVVWWFSMFAKVAPHRGETSHNFTDVQILAGTVLVSLWSYTIPKTELLRRKVLRGLGRLACRMSVTIFGSFSRLHVFFANLLRMDMLKMLLKVLFIVHLLACLTSGTSESFPKIAGPRNMGRLTKNLCDCCQCWNSENACRMVSKSERDFHFAATYNCDATRMVTLFEFPMDRNTLKNPYTNPGDL